MADNRLSLALPIDVARLFDSTVSQDLLDASTFQNSPDDVDLLASMLEDAEHEFRNATDRKFKISRVGVAGNRDTFEQATYKTSGHKLTKGTFTGVWSDFLPQEKSIMLDNDRVLPFDPDEGDAVFVYHGLGDGIGNNWEDVTDEQGEMWDILNYRSGRFTFSPHETVEYLLDYHLGGLSSGPEFLKRMRFAISYRYGGLGGSSDYATSTSLSASLTDDETETVSVEDGARFPSDGTKVLKIDREYVLADLQPDTDEMDIVERGIRGTTAAAHDADATVQYTPPSVRKAVASRAGMQLVSSGRYSDFLPDTEDSLDKSDVMDTLEATWDATVAALSA